MHIAFENCVELKLSQIESEQKKLKNAPTFIYYNKNVYLRNKNTFSV